MQISIIRGELILIVISAMIAVIVNVVSLTLFEINNVIYNI